MKINFPKPLGGEYHLIAIYFGKPFYNKWTIIELTLFNRTIQFEL